MAHPHLTCEQCIALFDKALHDYFNGDASDDASHASKQLGERLQTEANAFRRRNVYAAQQFDAITAYISEQANTWNYAQDVERFHAQGRAIALDYFQASPALVTQERLGTLCRLNHEYVIGKANSVPMSYRKADQVITVRFTLDLGFTDYLALPYQFLHEYTAHVYALDNDSNPLFNDGWMLYAAQSFFKRLNNIDDFYPVQASVFPDYLYQRLNSDARIFTAFAEDFDAWLDRSSKDAFQRITYELAALKPEPPQPANWINIFLLALYQEFSYGDRAALNRVVYNYSVKELGRYLWRCRHVSDYFGKYQPDAEAL